MNKHRNLWWKFVGSLFFFRCCWEGLIIHGVLNYCIEVWYQNVILIGSHLYHKVLLASLSTRMMPFEKLGLFIDYNFIWMEDINTNEVTSRRITTYKTNWQFLNLPHQFGHVLRIDHNQRCSALMSCQMYQHTEDFWIRTFDWRMGLKFSCNYKWTKRRGHLSQLGKGKMKLYTCKPNKNFWIWRHLLRQISLLTSFTVSRLWWKRISKTELVVKWKYSCPNTFHTTHIFEWKILCEMKSRECLPVKLGIW